MLRTNRIRDHITPLNHGNSTVVDELVHAEFGVVRRTVEPICVEVKQRESGGCRQMTHECERGARDHLGDAEGRSKILRESGFACTEVADKQDDIAGAQ